MDKDNFSIIEEKERLLYNYYKNNKLSELHQELRILRKTINSIKQTKIPDCQKEIYTAGVLDGLARVYSILLDEKLIDNDVKYQNELLREKIYKEEEI